MRSQLDCLPSFASDEDLAVAIVGNKAAKKWQVERLPTLAGKTGFPPVDDFHGGRSVPLVIRFYESYLASSRDGNQAAPAVKRTRLHGSWTSEAIVRFNGGAAGVTLPAASPLVSFPPQGILQKQDESWSG